MGMKKIWLGLSLICINLTVFADDQVIKMDTTPPPAEGMLATSQIPPINSTANPSAANPRMQQTPAPSNGNTPVASAIPDPAIEKAAAAATGVSQPPPAQTNQSPNTNNRPQQRTNGDQPDLPPLSSPLPPSPGPAPRKDGQAVNPSSVPVPAQPSVPSNTSQEAVII